MKRLDPRRRKLSRFFGQRLVKRVNRSKRIAEHVPLIFDMVGLCSNRMMVASTGGWYSMRYAAAWRLGEALSKDTRIASLSTPIQCRFGSVTYLD